MADVNKKKQKYHIFSKLSQQNEQLLAQGLNFNEKLRLNIKKHHSGTEKDESEKPSEDDTNESNEEKSKDED